MKSFHKLFSTNPVFLAPMFEVTNLPFRLFCKELGADAGVTEFISANQLYHVFKNNLLESSNVRYLLSSNEKEKPVGLQLFGFDAETFEKLASVFDPVKLGFDFLDLNIGCPVPKICNIGAGSKLLKEENLPVLENILRTITKAFPDIPFSIKIRAGYKKPIDFKDFTEVTNAIDLSHITIHPKLAVNPNKDLPNQANHDYSQNLVELSTHPIVINGGISSLAIAHQLVEKTGAAGSMIGRQAQKYPWVFNSSFQEQISTKDYINSLNHLLDLTEKFGYGKLYMVRDQILSMIRGFSGSKQKRQELQRKIESLDDLRQYVSNLDSHFTFESLTSIKNIATKTTIPITTN